MMPSLTIKNGRLHILKGDLTRSKTDAIVNAANSRLAGGGGVDGAIHRAAGPELPEACREIIKKIGSLPAGEAVITPGFNLPARYIIHTVGPVWQGGGAGEEGLLKSAYDNCLRLARENGIRTVAFPAVSCGVYGYPVEQAVPIALKALARGLESGAVEEASMVLHGDRAFEVWSRIAQDLFGQLD